MGLSSEIRVGDGCECGGKSSSFLVRKSDTGLLVDDFYGSALAKSTFFEKLPLNN